MAAPHITDIEYSRGDSVPMKFALVDENDVAINIAGFTFLMTVDPSPTPDDSTNNLFQLVGAIQDAPGGVVWFTPTPVQSDQAPAEYYHDIQLIDGSSALKTAARGKFDLQGDITK